MPPSRLDYFAQEHQISLEKELSTWTERAHIDFDDVYLSGGIRIGEKIITSPVKGAANGMKVQLAGMEKKDGKKMSVLN